MRPGEKSCDEQERGGKRRPGLQRANVRKYRCDASRRAAATSKGLLRADVQDVKSGEGSEETHTAPTVRRTRRSEEGRVDGDRGGARKGERGVPVK